MCPIAKSLPKRKIDLTNFIEMLNWSVNDKQQTESFKIVDNIGIYKPLKRDISSKDNFHNLKTFDPQSIFWTPEAAGSQWRNRSSYLFDCLRHGLSKVVDFFIINFIGYGILSI
jgi:hypothetical protein